MGITLAVFRIAGKTPVKNDRLQIVARWFDIWSLRRCKNFSWNTLRPKRFIGIKR